MPIYKHISTLPEWTEYWTVLKTGRVLQMSKPGKRNAGRFLDLYREGRLFPSRAAAAKSLIDT